MSNLLSRFGRRHYPFRAQSLEYQRTDVRKESLELAKGLHAGLPEDKLPAGYASDMSNLTVDDGALQPRSGLAAGAAHGLTAAPVEAAKFFDTEGHEHAVACTAAEFATWGRYSAGGWTALTVAGDSLAAADMQSPWQLAATYDPSIDKMLVVAVNGVNKPKCFPLGYHELPEVEDLTSFRDLDGHESAVSVAAFDNRMIYFNLRNKTAQSFPQRVVWSVRGQPRNHTLLEGAGFEDLMDMRGQGVKVIAERDSILLFSTHEVWRGRRRNDYYAFDFYAVSRDFGAPYARTVTRGPLGVTFLGEDKEIYLVQGESVVPLGPDPETGVSRIQKLLKAELGDPEVAWSIYNKLRRRYEFYYRTTEGSQKALFYHIDSGAWTAHDFAAPLYAGFEMSEPVDAGLTWDEATSTWDSAASTWDTEQPAGSGIEVYVMEASLAKPYDESVAVAAHWRGAAYDRANSFSERGDRSKRDILTEAWISYAAGYTTSLTVETIDPDADSTESSLVKTLPVSPRGTLFVPVWCNSRSPVVKLSLTGTREVALHHLQVTLREGGRF